MITLFWHVHMISSKDFLKGCLTKLVNVVTLKIRIFGFRIRKIPENRFRAQWFIFEFGAVEVKVVHNDSVVLFQCTLSHVV